MKEKTVKYSTCERSLKTTLKNSIKCTTTTISKTFMKWAVPKNPRLEFLLEKYGNPFEIKPKQENNMESESIAKNVMVRLVVIVAAGPMTAKKMNKRFPDNTTVCTLKNIFQNLFKIPSD